MSDTKHTPEMNDFWIDLYGEDAREVVCDLLLDIATQGVDYCDEVASRIVACVNACVGMDDPAKEIATLRARIAELEQPPAEPEPTTILGWLERLPDGYRERAIGQYDYNKGVLDSMADAIMFGLTWDETNEGNDFWLAVHNHYLNGTPLPPLPI